MRGYPLPANQWQFDGTNLVNATNATLAVVRATASSAGLYTIRVANALCTNTASARLTVTPKPLLRITEAMSQASFNALVLGHDDWWELTNCDTNAVNLRGYRFNDWPGTFDGSFVVTNDVVIRPGEAIIFARQMSPQAFKDWWGEENVPENQQILTYSGNSFDSTGEHIYFWNATALDRLDYIAFVDVVNLTPGVTLRFDKIDSVIGLYGEESIPGQDGAFQAVEADDIGSPGWITNHATRVYAPRLTTVVRDAAGVFLTWKARPNKRFELQFKNALSEARWKTLSQHTSRGFSFTVLDATAPDAAQRFYRLQLLPNLP